MCSTYPSQPTIGMKIVKKMFRTPMASTLRSLQCNPISCNLHCNTSPMPNLSTNHHSPQYGTFGSKAAQPHIFLQYRLKHSTTLTYEQRHHQFRTRHQSFHAPMSTCRKVYEKKRWLYLTGVFVVFAFLDLHLYLTRDVQKKEVEEKEGVYWESKCFSRKARDSTT